MRQRESRGGGEREGDTEAEAGSRLSAVSTEAQRPTWRSNALITRLPELKSDA